MALLTDAQAAEVAAAIAAVERRTDGELVTVLARQADEYHYIPTLWAALVALLSPGLMMLTPFWLSVGEVLVAQLGTFLVLATVLRAPPVLRRIIPGPVKRWRAGNLARRMFLEQNLHHTAGATGLLLFVAETERYVEIIADRGLAHVDTAHWQSIVDEFTEAVRGGRTLAGFRRAIERCGLILAEHAPATHAKNELPDHLIRL